MRAKQELLRVALARMAWTKKHGPFTRDMLHMKPLPWLVPDNSNEVKKETTNILFERNRGPAAAARCEIVPLEQRKVSNEGESEAR